MNKKTLAYIFSILSIVAIVGCTPVAATETTDSSTSEPTPAPSSTFDPDDPLSITFATAIAINKEMPALPAEDDLLEQSKQEASASPTPKPLELGVFGPGHRHVSILNPKWLEVTSAWAGVVDNEYMLVRAGIHWSDQDLNGAVDGLTEPTGLGGLLFESSIESGSRLTEEPVGGLTILSFDEETHTLHLLTEDGTEFEFNVQTYELIGK